MLLKSLHIIGFKSFAKKTDLFFTSDITGVVGPNGSGKSNVVEAFRFVLGEQSLKSMRGKKGEDMIFNGGKDMPRSNRASVKVVFDNKENPDNSYNRLFNKFIFDEVSLERVVNRDGNNEYYINGSAVRLKDISELLAEANIGASGHHIISQGEADRLLSSSNKDRKEMIEEALGLKVYHFKKEESKKRLIKTREHIKEIESLRREIAPHLRFLKKQIEKIEKAKEVREELKKLYINYFETEKYLIDIEELSIKESYIAPQAEYDLVKNELLDTKKILEANKTSSELTNKLFDIENHLKKIRNDRDDLSRSIGRFEGQISYLEKTIENKKKKYIDDQNKEDKDFNVSYKEIDILLKKIKTIFNDIKNNILNTNDIKEATNDLLQELNNYTEKHSRNNNINILNIENELSEINIIHLEIKKLENDKSTLDKKEEELLKTYNHTKEIINNENTKNVEAEKNLIRLISKEHELNNLFNTLRVRENSLKIRNENYEKELLESTILVGVGAIRFEIKKVEKVIDVNDISKANNEIKHNLEKFKIRLEELGGAGDESVIKEYDDTENRDKFLMNELTDLEKTLSELEIMIQDIDNELQKLFESGLSKINSQFSLFFKQMFGGGEAKLVLTEEKKRLKEDEEMDEDVQKEYGIDVFVSLPHKKLKGLSMLSGGERALTSIALLFAMSQVNPPPFIILDETDAALDEANSRRYGDMIELLSKKSELILVTHNRETMSRAGVLYGVTMGGTGLSQLLSISFDEASLNAK